MLDDDECALGVLRETTEVKVTYAKPLLRNTTTLILAEEPSDKMLHIQPQVSTTHREFENLLGMINETKKELLEND